MYKVSTSGGSVLFSCDEKDDAVVNADLFAKDLSCDIYVTDEAEETVYVAHASDYETGD